MGLSDCPKCWDTPCTCSYDYRNWGPTKLKEQIKMLEKVLKDNETKDIFGVSNPQPNYLDKIKFLDSFNLVKDKIK